MFRIDLSARWHDDCPTCPDLHWGRIVGYHLGDVTLTPYVNVVSCSKGGHLHTVMLIVMPSILFLSPFHPLS